MFARNESRMLVGGLALHSGLALAQPVDAAAPSAVAPTVATSEVPPAAPETAPTTPTSAAPAAPAPPISAVQPTLAPAASTAQPAVPPATSVPPGWALVPIQPQAPQPPQQAQIQPQQPAEPPQPRKLERDERWFTIGVGPLLLGNVHWLDKPEDRSVSVGRTHGTDERYPGFVGADATLGLMVDLRFWHFVGIEVDLFRQNDRGTGKLEIKDAGNLCFLPGVAIPYTSERYRLTIGQWAWHVPLLFKLTIPGSEVVVPDGEVDREFRRWFGSFAVGPEFVFPSNAALEVSPANGLPYPVRASASSYVMVTGAVGLERRVATSHDIRLLFSLRGSYNPKAGNSAMKRGQYAVVDEDIVPIAYKSEWRYQAALTFGVGWFF